MYLALEFNTQAWHRPAWFAISHTDVTSRGPVPDRDHPTWRLMRFWRLLGITLIDALSARLELMLGASLAVGEGQILVCHNKSISRSEDFMMSFFQSQNCHRHGIIADKIHCWAHYNYGSASSWPRWEGMIYVTSYLSGSWLSCKCHSGPVCPPIFELSGPPFTNVV